MELTIVYKATEHYVEVAADVRADGRVALSRELLQLQLLSLVGVAPPAQALLSSRGQLLLRGGGGGGGDGAADTEDEELLLLLQAGERRPRLFLFALGADDAAPPLAADWPLVCSRATFGNAPVVQRAFATPTGKVICQPCADTCASSARPMTPRDWNASDAVAQQFVSEIVVVAGDVDVPAPPGFQRLPEDLNHSASGDHVYLCVKRGGNRAVTQISVDFHPRDSSAAPLRHNAGADCNSGNASATRVHLSADSVFRTSDEELNTLAVTDIRAVVGVAQQPPTPAHVQIPRNLNEGVAGALVQPIFLWYAAAPLGAFVCDASSGHSDFGECLFQSRHARELSSISDLDSSRLDAMAATARSRAAADEAALRTLYQSGEKAMLGRLHSTLARARSYESKQMQAEALRRIPVQTLHERARANASPMPSFQDELVLQLLHWFKREFFTWTNQPPCASCGCADTRFAHSDAPNTPEERSGDAGRVEVYQCPACGSLTRFPRYNDPVKLLDTRTGRCGEWANCFTLCCRAMGFEARYALDVTDHVWTEVYSEHSQRWLHCDSCEDQLDCPLTYEVGWGKQLSYVFSASHEDVVDAARRYTQDWDAMRSRRQEVSEQWLGATIAQMNESIQRALPLSRVEVLRARAKAEHAELVRGRVATSSEAQGRVSGSAEWRSQRSEDGRQTGEDAQSSSSASAPAVSGTQVVSEALVVELSQQLCRTMLLGCENQQACPSPYCRHGRDSSGDATERAASALRLVGSFNQKGFTPASLASLLCPEKASELQWVVLARKPLLYLQLQDADTASGAIGWLVDSSGNENHVANTAGCPVRKPFQIPRPDDRRSHGLQLLPRQSLAAAFARPLGSSLSLSFLARFDLDAVRGSGAVGASADILSVAVGSRFSLSFRVSSSPQADVSCELQAPEHDSRAADVPSALLSFGTYAHVGLVDAKDEITVLVNAVVVLQLAKRAQVELERRERESLTLLGPATSSVALPLATAVVSHLAVFQQDEAASSFAAFCSAMQQRFVRAAPLRAFGADGALPDKRCALVAANAQRGYRVAKVSMWGGEFVDGVQFVYEALDADSTRVDRFVLGPLVGNASAVGAASSPTAELRLLAGEVVADVSGRKGAWTDSLRLRTSFGREVACGGGGGGDFRVPVPSGCAVRAIAFSVGDHLVDPVVFVGDEGAASRASEQSEQLRDLEATLAASSPSERQSAVSAALRYLENIAKQPEDAKFHRILATNAFFAKHIAALGAERSRAFMRWCGFAPHADGDQHFYVLVGEGAAEDRSSDDERAKAADRVAGRVHRRIAGLRRFGA